MLTAIISRTLRVPRCVGKAGDGSSVARQLDVAVMSVGFKLSGDLLGHLSTVHPSEVRRVGAEVLLAIRCLVGDHVHHNVYFEDFPSRVPDTHEFWSKCLAEALSEPPSRLRVALSFVSFGRINLLDLPTYGRYQHSFEEMVAAHDDLLASASDRITVLHLGETLDQECLSQYLSLAGSRTPLADSDLNLLKSLAEVCVDEEQPPAIPARESRAVINQVRLANNRPLLLNTVTDVLRLATAISAGSPSLEAKTRFKSFSRAERRGLLAGLESVVSSAEERLIDVDRYPEEWKRLGERLHPHEYPSLARAQQVFAVARGEQKVLTLAARVEEAFRSGDPTAVLSLLSQAPGMLFRSVDRLARTIPDSESGAFLRTVENVTPRVSGRVVLSLRQHLQNRHAQASSRIYANRRGRFWIEQDNRNPLSADLLGMLLSILDRDVSRRLPVFPCVVYDPAALGLALPLSNKARPDGFGAMPRGSVTPVGGELLRFFVHWKQRAIRTDYDLSLLMLDRNFEYAGQASWTNLRAAGGTVLHSGDIVDAPNGASEFIDVQLGKTSAAYIVPQVNVYSGEKFDVAEEAFFGYMTRDAMQRGQPFEARTVRMKSDLAGKGRVAIPLVFQKRQDGTWAATWLHMYLTGRPNFNRVEANRVNTTFLAKDFITRDYLTLRYMLDLLSARAKATTVYQEGMVLQEPVSFIGFEVPEGLPRDSVAYTPHNLHELIPD